MAKPKAEGSASARKTASKKKTNSRNVKAPRGNVNSGRVNRREKLQRKTVNKKKNNSRKVNTGRAGVNNGRKQPSGKTGKRTGYLPWEDYFMSLAFVSGDRSKDNRTQVGACIVNSQKRIVGLGYNGMPNGLSDDKFPWRQWKEGDDILQSKNPYVCHAEMNAVVNKNQADIRGCKMYVSLYPCNECAKIIIQSGITEVIYYSDKNLRKVMADKSTQKNSYKAILKATGKMFKAAKVKCRKYKGSRKEVKLPFESINKEK